MLPQNDDINLWEVLHRKRLALGPFYAATAAAAAGAGLSTLDTAPTATLLASAGFAGSVLIKKKIKDKMRRVYAYTVLGTSTAWVMAAHEFWEYEPGWVGVALVSGTLLTGIPWWLSSRKRAQVRMEASIQDWPQLAERIGLGATQMIGVTMTASGYRGKLAWAPGMQKVDNVIDRASDIESVLNAPRGSVRLEYDGLNPNSARFSVVLKDPHAEPQPWPLPQVERRAEEPMAIGVREDGEVITFRRYVRGRGVRNLLIGGMNDSGKSSLVNVDVAESAISSDVCQIGMDFKQVELTPWKPVMLDMITDVAQAWRFLLAMVAPDGVLKERQTVLAERGARWWDTDIDGPILSIPIDEFRDLLATAPSKVVDAFVQIATKGRALGIRFVASTQYPTLEALASSQIREQIFHRACFRMASETGENYVIPDQRIRAHKIPANRPGTCYVRHDDGVDRMPVRIYYLDDDLVKLIVLNRTGKTPELDSRTEAALLRNYPEFANRERYEVVPVNGSGDDGDRDSTGTPAAPVRHISGEDRDSTGTPAEVEQRAAAMKAALPELAAALERELDGTPESKDRDSTGTPATPTGTRPAVGGTEDLDLAELLRQRRAHQSPEQRQRAEQDRQSELTKAAPKRELSKEDAGAKICELAAAAGPKGAKGVDLYRAVGRSSSWFYGWIAEMDTRAGGNPIKRNSEGRWVIAEDNSGHSA